MFPCCYFTAIIAVLYDDWIDHSKFSALPLLFITLVQGDRCWTCKIRSIASDLEATWRFIICSSMWQSTMMRYLHFWEPWSVTSWTKKTKHQIFQSWSDQTFRDVVLMHLKLHVVILALLECNIVACQDCGVLKSTPVPVAPWKCKTEVWLIETMKKPCQTLMQLAFLIQRDEEHALWFLQWPVHFSDFLKHHSILEGLRSQSWLRFVCGWSQLSFCFPPVYLIFPFD